MASLSSIQWLLFLLISLIAMMGTRWWCGVEGRHIIAERCIEIAQQVKERVTRDTDRDTDRDTARQLYLVTLWVWGVASMLSAFIMGFNAAGLALTTLGTLRYPLSRPLQTAEILVGVVALLSTAIIPVRKKMNTSDRETT